VTQRAANLVQQLCAEIVLIVTSIIDIVITGIILVIGCGKEVVCVH
jgi:hypothetical protein